MKLLKFIAILTLLTLITVSCSKNNYQKGKKGDFLFRKCTSCEKVEF